MDVHATMTLIEALVLVVELPSLFSLLELGHIFPVRDAITDPAITIYFLFIYFPGPYILLLN